MFKTVAVFAALIALAFASDVLVLTTDNFDEVVGNEEIILVEFYAPWCGHCKKLEPEYEKAATALSGKVALAKVDATENQALASQYGVRGYPTLKIFRDGEEASAYNGGRTSDAIVAYMNRQLLPAITDIDSADAAAAFAADGDLVVLGFFTEEGDDVDAFKSAASALRDEFTFGLVTDAAVAAAYEQVSGNTIVVFKNLDDDVLVYDGAFEASAIKTYIKENALPLIDEVGPENYRAYVDTGLPMGMVFVKLDDEDKLGEYVAAYRQIAQELVGEMVFVYVDADKYIQQAQKIGLSGDVVPSFAVDNLATGLHYAYDETADPFDVDAVTAFCKAVVAGEVEPTIKSEPVPEPNDAPVTVLVADNFVDIALDETKDVLVEFYAPWCGHCKRLAPIYDELGEAFENVESVVIAKMDATANDIPPEAGVQVSGFPTLYFFPAEAGVAPQKYDGGRTLDDLQAYVLNAAVAPIDADAVASEDVHDEL